MPSWTNIFCPNCGMFMPACICKEPESDIEDRAREAKRRTRLACPSGHTYIWEGKGRFKKHRCSLCGKEFNDDEAGVPLT